MKDTFFALDSSKDALLCHGDWTLKNFYQIKKMLESLHISKKLKVLDGSDIQQMDSAGALILQQFLQALPERGKQLNLKGFKENHATLLKLVARPNDDWLKIPAAEKLNFLARLGKSVVVKAQEFLNFLAFIGEVTVDAVRLLLAPSRIPWRAGMSAIETTGVYALPIIALLSFLIGVVLTYQMGLQLRNYGANIYIVDLLGLSILREFSPLITAIIIAGRTGSAFTAQLGTMKIREEVDALRTMGIAPYELLILPKVIAMMLVLPLLTVWSSLFGILGGMCISHSMLQISYVDFLQRFKEVIAVKSYYSGMIKAPVFGLIISAVGCYQGMQVQGSATSVGEKTTTSVVQAIFFIIVADAAFSILFSWLGI